MDAVSFDYEKPAFTVIQKDGFDSFSLPLVQSDKGFSNSSSTGTIIIACSRNERTPNFISRRRLCKSNEHLLATSLQLHQVSPLKFRYSKSHESLQNDGKISTLSGKSSMDLSTETFTRILNAKLRRTQELEEKADQIRLRNERLHYVNHPRPFVATVKTGEFLMPPPKVAALLGISSNHVGSTFEESDLQCRTRFKHLMALNHRRPEVRHQSHKARCPALRATEEFSYYSSNLPSTITSIFSIDDRMRHLRRPHEMQTRALRLPQKLDPIKGDEKAFLNRGIGQQSPCSNIVFDKRVMREPSYTSSSINCWDQSRSEPKKLAQKKGPTWKNDSPPLTCSKKNEPIQTDFFEELFDHPEEAEIAIQTDYLFDRPLTPKHCFSVEGKDVTTQTDPGELFNYDEEVQPILEILIGKTIEQSLLEVLEEEEVETLKEQQRKFQELRAVENAELERLKEEDKRLREEKERREKQESLEKQADAETMDRVAATLMLTSYIAELLPAVLESLKISGVLVDDIKAEVEEDFMPWLMKQVKKEVGTVVESKEILKEILCAILTNRAAIYKRLGEEYDYSRDKITKELSVDLEEETKSVTNFLTKDLADYQ